MTTCGYHNLMKLPVAWQNFWEAEVVCKGKESMILYKDKADGFPGVPPDSSNPLHLKESVFRFVMQM